MDAVETISTMESKAERIARYKAERRRELAERYANMEELSSKYSRPERQREKAPDTGEEEKNTTLSFSSTRLMVYIWYMENVT